MDPNPSTPSPPDDEALRWKLSNFKPRKQPPPSNDPRLEAFLNGSVDFTKPDDVEAE